MEFSKTLAVTYGLSLVMPIAVASMLLYSVLGARVTITESVVTLQTTAVSSIFEAIVGILYIAFYWIVVASVIAGGIEMASSGARPVLELFGLPVPRSSPEGGFRTMWTAVMAWIIANAIIQSMFPGVTLPSPVSVFLGLSTVNAMSITTVGNLGTIIGIAYLLGVDVPIIMHATGSVPRVQPRVIDL